MNYTKALYVSVLVVITGLAGYLNYQFGHSIGEAHGQGWQFGTLLAACSALLLTLGFVRTAAKRANDKPKRDLAIAITAVVALVEIVGVAATIGVMRFSATDEVNNHNVMVANLDSEIEEAKKTVDSYAQVPLSVEAINAKIEEKYSQVVEGKTVRARLTDCSNRNKGPKTYDLYCPDIKALEAEKVAAGTYWSAKAKLSELRGKRSGETKKTTGNEQAKILHDVIPLLSEDQWQSVVAVFLAVVVVMIGVFGPEVIPAPASVNLIEVKPELPKVELPKVELPSVPAMVADVPELPAPVAVEDVKPKKKKRKKRVVKVVEPVEPPKPQVVYRYRTKTKEVPVEVVKVKWRVRKAPKKKKAAVAKKGPRLAVSNV